LKTEAKLVRKNLPVLGIVVAAACFFVSTLLYPGGYDWRRHYISTLLRGDQSPARVTAIVGMLIFCLSVAVLFERLARNFGPTPTSKAIRIGGIGSMVYASLAITPMHDLMVMISIPFFVFAVLALLLVLYTFGETGFLISGIFCFLLFVVSVVIYYSGHFVSVLPWAQRTLFALFATWLITLENCSPHKSLVVDANKGSVAG
jgi:hypothetical protein